MMDPIITGREEPADLKDKLVELHGRFVAATCLWRLGRDADELARIEGGTGNGVQAELYRLRAEEWRRLALEVEPNLLPACRGAAWRLGMTEETLNAALGG